MAGREGGLLGSCWGEAGAIHKTFRLRQDSLIYPVEFFSFSFFFSPSSCLGCPFDVR